MIIDATQLNPGNMGGYLWDPHESLGPSERSELQLKRLKRTLTRVEGEVPFFRELFDNEGFRATEMKSLEQLASLPFTTKDDLREHYPFGLLAEPLDRVIRVHASSGTTGKPTVVAYTKDDVDLWAELMARTLAGGGVGPSDIVHNAYGYGLFTGGLGFHYGAERVNATVVPMSGGNSERQLKLMRDFGSTVLCCTPSYALSLAERADFAEVDIRSLPLRVGFFGAEPWSERMRTAIEERLSIKALDIYGLSEVIGPGVAAECLERDGLHVAEDHFIPEIIDPDSGISLPDGELGELVFTSITKQALPLIRYRTRDLTRLNRKPCACGRTTVRMERVLGRSDDMLIVRGINVFPSQIETIVLAVDGAEPHYEIAVDRNERHLDALEVRVEASPSVWKHAERRVELERQLDQQIRSTLGITVTVSVVAPNEIPRSEGKAARVVDNRRL